MIPKIIKKIASYLKVETKAIVKEHVKFEKKSYSQSGEDLIIKYIFNARGVSNFTYLDIGANHPYNINNTFAFYLDGCRGVNIEPNPIMIERFKSFRPDDISIAAGAAEKTGEMIYYHMDVNELNTFSKEQATYLEDRGHKITKESVISVLTIGSIIKEYFNDRSPNVVFIDAEGMDLILIKSIDFDKYSPEVLCVESISYELNGNGIKDTELIEYVLSKGYIMYADTNINSIFVKKSFWIK